MAREKGKPYQSPRLHYASVYVVYEEGNTGVLAGRAREQPDAMWLRDRMPDAPEPRQVLRAVREAEPCWLVVLT